MASFDKFKAILAVHEGGYQNLAGDTGNYNSLGQRVGTNRGISARFYETVIGRPPTVADMKAITAVQADQIFKKYFWDAVHGDALDNQSVANIIADHCVNGGESPIAKLVQTILRDNFGKNIKVDGDIGPATAAAINSVDQARLFELIKAGRIQLYNNIGGQFLNTWLSRTKSFVYSATEKKKCSECGRSL